MIGLWITTQALEELKPINEARVASGLKPLTLPEYFKRTQGIKVPTGGDWHAAARKHLTLEARAEVAALKAVPKGTFTNIIDDLASKIALPATAAGAGMEALRKRKNEMIAKEVAAEKIAAESAASKGAKAIARTGSTAADLIGLSKSGIGIGTSVGALIGAADAYGKGEEEYLARRNARKFSNPEDAWADIAGPVMNKSFWSNLVPSLRENVNEALGGSIRRTKDGDAWITNKMLGYTKEEVNSNPWLYSGAYLENIPEGMAVGLYDAGKYVVNSANDLGRFAGEKIGNAIYGNAGGAPREQKGRNNK